MAFAQLNSASAATRECNTRITHLQPTFANGKLYAAASMKSNAASRRIPEGRVSVVKLFVIVKKADDVILQFKH